MSANIKYTFDGLEQESPAIADRVLCDHIEMRPKTGHWRQGILGYAKERLEYAGITNVKLKLERDQTCYFSGSFNFAQMLFMGNHSETYSTMLHSFKVDQYPSLMSAFLLNHSRDVEIMARAGIVFNIANGECRSPGLEYENLSAKDMKAVSNVAKALKSFVCAIEYAVQANILVQYANINSGEPARQYLSRFLWSPEGKQLEPFGLST